MDSDDVDAAGDPESSRCQRRLETILRRHSPEDAPQGRFARGSQEDGKAQPAQLAQVAHHLEIVLGRLAEAEARVDDQVPARDAGLLRPIECGLQVGE